MSKLGSCSRKLWLEVALNGGRGRAWQPLMPITVDEIVEEAVACAEAGAAIIHYHAYDPVSGLQDERNLGTHRRIIAGIRSRCDALVYPTTTMRVLGRPPLAESERFSIEHALLADQLIEAFVLDPGSMNMSHRSSRSKSYVYYNEVEEITRGFEFAAQFRIPPALAIYELGFARLARSLAEASFTGFDPSFYRVMFSDGFSFGLPPSSEAIHLVDEAMRLLKVQRWMLAGLDFSSGDWIELVGALGVDLRVGLEDAPRGCCCSNLDLVTNAAHRLRQQGRDIASPAEVRSGLAFNWGSPG